MWHIGSVHPHCGVRHTCCTNSCWENAFTEKMHLLGKCTIRHLEGRCKAGNSNGEGSPLTLGDGCQLAGHPAHPRPSVHQLCSCWDPLPHQHDSCWIPDSALKYACHDAVLYLKGNAWDIINTERFVQCSLDALCCSSINQSFDQTNMYSQVAAGCVITA